MWPNRPAAFVAANADLLTSDVDGEFDTSGDGIARGIRIVGDIRGSHDLSIAGSVTGSVFLPRNEVVVRASAEVIANVTARVIEVEGTVTADSTRGRMHVQRFGADE
jgi:cytoskeletal protein CcmA (bactofilin family)